MEASKQQCRSRVCVGAGCRDRIAFVRICSGKFEKVSHGCAPLISTIFTGGRGTAVCLS